MGSNKPMTNRIGESKLNKNGERMEIIVYRRYKDIDVLFESGDIATCQYIQFKKGNIKNHAKRLGNKKVNSQGLVMEIVEYSNSLDMVVEFEDGVKMRGVYDQFYKGKFANPNVKAVFGRGHIGEGKYNSVNENGDHPKSYRYWTSMFTRCYGEVFRTYRQAYKDCDVGKSFLCYQDFMEWYDKNYYEIGDEVMTLDKDLLLKGNKVYSKETCVFIPERINTLINMQKSKRGKYPIGVHKHSKNQNYISKRSGDEGTSSHLGSFDTSEQAFYAYKANKEEYVKEIAKRYKSSIPQNAYDALINWKVEIDD